jgi:hypothetical protein
MDPATPFRGRSRGCGDCSDIFPVDRTPDPRSSIPTSAARTLLQHDARFFAIGFPTAAASLPTAGSAVFEGIVIGRATADRPAYFPRTYEPAEYRLTGSLRVMVNFGARTAVVELQVRGRQFDCRVTCQPDISIGATGSGTSANGIASFDLPGGSARFFLAGPSAEEIGGSLLTTVVDPNEARRTLTLVSGGTARR